MSAAEAVGGPPSLNAGKVVAGHLHASKQDMTKAVARMLLAEGRSVKIGRGGSR